MELAAAAAYATDLELAMGGIDSQQVYFTCLAGQHVAMVCDSFAR